MEQATLSAKPSQKLKLLDQVRYTVRAKHYSYNTEKEYARRIKEFIIFHKSNIPMNKMIHLNVNYDESLLQRAIKSVGGKWNRKEGVWDLPYKEVLALGLEERMVRKAESVSKNKKSYKRAPPVESVHI